MIAGQTWNNFSLAEEYKWFIIIRDCAANLSIKTLPSQCRLVGRLHPFIKIVIVNGKHYSGMVPFIILAFTSIWTPAGHFHALLKSSVSFPFCGDLMRSLSLTLLLKDLDLCVTSTSRPGLSINNVRAAMNTRALLPLRVVLQGVG